MRVCTLVKTIIISNSIAGEHKFEIYQCESEFYTDISKKNTDGFWVVIKDEYGLTRALDVDDAAECCIKYVENIELDIKSSPII